MRVLYEVLSQGPMFTPQQLSAMRQAYETGGKELGIDEGPPEDRTKFAELIVSLMSAIPDLSSEALCEEAVIRFKGALRDPLSR